MFRHFIQHLRFKQLAEFQGKSIKRKTTPGYIIVKLQKIKDMDKSLMGGGSNFYKVAIVQTHSWLPNSSGNQEERKVLLSVCSNKQTAKPMYCALLKQSLEIKENTYILLHYIYIYMYFCVCKPSAAAKSLQSCPTLCDSIDGSSPGSPIPGILQARTLEWVAISFSNSSF